MDLRFFIQGVIIGFAIAAPFGPVGILCVNRTLSQGKLSGFVSGLGAVTGDVFYAVVAAYGIRVISSFINDNSVVFRLAGSVFLAGIGLKVFYMKSDKRAVSFNTGRLAGDYSSSALLTFSNPVTLVVFGVLFAALGLGSADIGFSAPTSMVAGILTGSIFCWLALSLLVDALRSSFDLSFLSFFNKISGILLMGFSLFVVFSIFMGV